MRRRSERAERGAIIIQVAVCLLGLTAFSALVIDYGILWTARSQAQNAADAGALAGTIARAFDDLDATPTELTVDSVIAGVQANPIWGVATPSDATQIGYTCPTGYTGKCVRVIVHRDGFGGSETIPTWFASLVGVNDQHIVATATGHVGVGNSTTCMKPWIVPDRWIEDVSTPVTEYNPPSDVFAPPGFKTLNIGDPIILHPGDTGIGKSQSPNDYYQLEPPEGSYADAIAGCTFKAKVGDTVQVKGNDGSADPLTHVGVTDLWGQDSGSGWDGAHKRVSGGCQPHCTGFGGGAPRQALIGLYDPNQFAGAAMPVGNSFGVTLINIVSVYLLGSDTSGNIYGFITTKAGGFIESGAAPVDDASFLPVIQLIR